MKESFNIEKWRKEHPINYIKFLDILFSATEPNVINYMFMQIYKATRLYVPDNLYKYYSLDENEELNKIKIQTLMDGKIYMSCSKDFNDPFDEKAFFYESKELSSIERLKECKGKVIDDFSNFFRVTSLTGNNYNSMPMWAHYANNHCGYCVCYDTTDDRNLELKAGTFQIQYTDERVNITSFMYKYSKMMADKIDENIKKGIKVTEIDDLSIIYITILLSNLKHTSWEYENEFRCLFGQNDNNLYCDAYPKAIYIGMKCVSENEKKLIDVAKKYSIPVYKMKYVEESTGFVLKYEEIGY